MTHANEKKMILCKLAPSEDSLSLNLVKFPHPKYRSLYSWYLINNNAIYELQNIGDENENSLFIDNFVREKGDMYILSPFDPMYLLLPHLIRSRKYSPLNNKPCFMALDQMLCDSPTKENQCSEPSSLDYNRLLSIPGCREQIALICDSKQIAGEKDLFYSLNDDKLIQWLQCKVKKIQATLAIVGENNEEEEDVQTALLIVNEYISESLFQSVCASFGVVVVVDDMSSMLKHDPKKRKLSALNETEIDSEMKTTESEQNGSHLLPKTKRQNQGQYDLVDNTTVRKVIGACDPDLERVQIRLTSEKPKPSVRTNANKQLDKVNTKGMKSMFSYFSPSKT
ncbi:hypothetical protein RFI_04545 [Reticulomyxa filosa]|uniref:Ribonuclease H2 subunit B n=1 Tax=Reticulomyxa filosa TaxID=46433 RepID=X6P368_RETFI|nr:hypothetical protein RFI_04545 [Reticulomyxa filosa]|eukprot:ETO32573.1 hypothetical protein RFI_04545 [Reticulomyxa filosa]